MLIETGLRIVAGILLLAFGRRLFWMFVGILGFVSGFYLATQFLRGQPELVFWGVAVVAGIIGIFLAFFLQRFAIALSGFLSGSYFALMVFPHLGLGANISQWVIILIGGVVGAILLSLIFDPVLIFLTSVTGALLIAEISPYSAIVFFVLLILGIVIQASLLRKRAPAPDVI
jgi:hypothetical protein